MYVFSVLQYKYKKVKFIFLFAAFYQSEKITGSTVSIILRLHWYYVFDGNNKLCIYVAVFNDE